MLLKITKDQAVQIVTNAVNASVPVGMGILQYKDKQYTPDEVAAHFYEGGVYLDYFEGRMVKLSMSEVEGGWTVPDRKPNVEYQSWARAYPTYEDLANSVNT